jgi:hypothetical protein
MPSHSHKTKKLLILIAPLALLLMMPPAMGQDFPALDEALPAGDAINGQEVVFDFDTDSCLPSAGISRTGEKNGGLKPSGSQTGDCRSSNFMETSNTYHRYACKTVGSDRYCGHIYALYFEKDQAGDAFWTWFGGSVSGHRHDWEHAVVWTKNSQMTHASYSAHGDLTTRPVSELDRDSQGRVKIVYHDNSLVNGHTHSFRFAKTNEVAENPYGRFITPPIVSWTEMVGEGVSNAQMRDKLNSFDYGSGVVPIKDTDNRFINELNGGKPASYPTFAWADADPAPPADDAIVTGSLKQLDVGAEIWGVDADDYIYRWNSSGWTEIPGRLKHVSVGPDGDVWGVNSSDYVYRYNDAGNNWTRMDGSLKQIDVGAEVWGVDSADYIYRWTGSGWQRIPGRLQYVSVGPDGDVWGLEPDGTIVQYIPATTNWTTVEGRLVQIDVGADVWGVNADNQLYRWSGSDWIQMDGEARHVSAGNFGTVWATLPDNRIKMYREERVAFQRLDIDAFENDTWHRVDFKRSFAEAPVVVMGPLSFNGADPATVRVRNVTTEGFEFEIDEWDYLDGAHIAETLSYLAVAPGTHEGNGLRVVAGRADGVDHNWQAVGLGGGFGAAPVVLAQQETDVGSQATTVRLRNVGTTAFEVKVEEEEANDGTHAREGVGYIAIETGTGLIPGTGVEVSSGLTGRAVRESWYRIDFGAAVAGAAPFMAQMQSYWGPDTASLRYRNQDATGAEVAVDEEASLDGETGHTEEDVGWLVIGE